MEGFNVYLNDNSVANDEIYPANGYIRNGEFVYQGGASLIGTEDFKNNVSDMINDNVYNRTFSGYSIIITED